ncbi:MAG: hypothetical protein ACHQRJ_07530 [Alphaproteobacteria bacterium]
MRALKALVIVMGILIVAGMAVVGTTLVKRAMNLETPRRVNAAAERAAPAPGSAVERPYGPVEIALPPGARILRTSPAGRRLIVELELAGGGERVLVVELESGALLGTIDLKPQP